MDKQKRPRLTLNLLLTIMAAVEGEERTNRQEIKTYGEGQEDDPAAHGLNRLLKWVMNQCGGEFALSDYFRAGRRGRRRLDRAGGRFLRGPGGQDQPRLRRRGRVLSGPARHLADAAARAGISTAPHVRGGRDRGALAGQAPGAEGHSDLGRGRAETDGRGFRDIYLTPNDVKTPKIYDSQDEAMVRRRDLVAADRAGLGRRERAERPPRGKGRGRVRGDEGAAPQDEQRAHLEAIVAGQPPMQQVPDPMRRASRPAAQADSRRRSRRAAPDPLPLSGVHLHEVLLEKRKCPVKGLKRQPYVPFRALFDKVKKEWFGVLRPLIDPQKQHNVEQSAIVQWTQLMPKQAWMGPKGSFHNKQEWQEKIAQPGAMLEYNAQRGKPEPVPAAGAAPPHDRHGLLAAAR
jgi:hypothetical protein